jgi:ABC-type bacteriocin/lantibiotic exporter with double-glycine peptidase domain
LYRYVWRVTRAGQLRICVMTAVVVPLSAVPLELQRRIIDEALHDRSLRLLLLLGAAYLAVVVGSNIFKYGLNMTKGRVLETVARDLRYRIVAGTDTMPRPIDEGTVISMASAETEDIAGFASESLSVPLLQVGTILSVIGYLAWVEPLIAALAVVLYLPQALVVPYVQHAINRLIRRRTWLVRKLGRNAVDVGRTTNLTERERHRRADTLIEGIFETRMNIYLRKFFLTLFGNVLDALGPLMVLVVGGYMVIEGQTEISTLVVFISGLQKVARPWDELINFYRTASNARIAYGLMAEALSSSPPADITTKLAEARA